jgi:hypothetical protein
MGDTFGPVITAEQEFQEWSERVAQRLHAATMENYELWLEDQARDLELATAEGE